MLTEQPHAGTVGMAARAKRNERLVFRLRAKGDLRLFNGLVRGINRWNKDNARCKLSQMRLHVSCQLVVMDEGHFARHVCVHAISLINDMQCLFHYPITDQHCFDASSLLTRRAECA